MKNAGLTRLYKITHCTRCFFDFELLNFRKLINRPSFIQDYFIRVLFATKIVECLIKTNLFNYGSKLVCRILAKQYNPYLDDVA